MAIPTTRTGPLDHPAIQAWAELRPERVEPVRIGKLQRRSKGSVYRLEGVGPAGSDVIAKRSSRARILQERTIYERVLPALPVSTVRYYGVMEEPAGECCWLFLEDAGGAEYSPGIAAHRALAARWLGLLHTSAAHLPVAAHLPDRGPRLYREHLGAACDTIRRNLPNPALTADDAAVLTTIVRQCDVVASHWSEVERLCDAMPRTVVHGDFAPKNMRVRTGADGLTLLPFDFGSAGWGIVAPDLVQAGQSADRWDYWANPDLATYCSIVRDVWPHLDAGAMESLAVIGQIFRCLVCIDLTARSLATAWVERAMRNMRIYEAEMADAIRAVGWMPGQEA